MNAVIRNVGPDGLEINVAGKLKAEDYRLFKELAEKRIDRFGQVNLLVVITEFSGWTPADLWQDIKLDVDHYGDVGRLAIVGSVPLNHWMATLTKPFTSAVVQYYPMAEIEAARMWIRDLPLEQLAHYG
ncbi:MAG: STAS/SEC14 domain-containing protein [Halioglobus sp.]|nr:STAS/SEC14 domain-containing protein [Halioglobus sp.]